MIKHFKEKELHTFLFPLLFIVKHFFSILTTEPNYTPVQTYFVWLVFFVLSLIVCALPVFFLSKIFSIRFGRTRGALLSTVAFIPLFFFQDFFILINFLSEGYIRIRWLLFCVPVFIFLLSYLIISNKKSFLVVTEYLNITSLVLIVSVTLTLTYNFSELKPKRLSYKPALYDLNCVNCPDIYFFILDSYASNKSLRDYFHFSNERFTRNLEKLGFDVVDDGFSSYTKTIYSLGSTLNLDKVENLNQYYEEDVLRIIKSNSVMKSLEKFGYQIYNYSLFDVLDRPKYYSISTEMKPHFVNQIFQNTILKYFFDNVDSYSNLYSVHTKIFNELRQESSRPSNQSRFFYVHVLAPHSPFVIDADGKEVSILSLKRDQNQAYINQVAGLNGMVHESIQSVLSNNPNSIVIVQGDHGSRLVKGRNKEIEATKVFLAYKLPQGESVGQITNSNEIFRFLFELDSH